MLTKQNPVRHRYGWTLEEILIITFVLLLWVGVFFINSSPAVLIVAGIVVLGITYGLIHLGKKRKDASALEAYLEDGTLFVIGFGLGKKNSLPINSAHSVTTKKHGISDSLVFQQRSTSANVIVIPERIAVQDELREVVTEMFNGAKNKTKDATELFERIVGT